MARALGAGVPNILGMSATTPAAPAGWYRDPEGPGLRFWDGSCWTEHRHPTPSQQTLRPAMTGTTLPPWMRKPVVWIAAGATLCLLLLGVVISASTQHSPSYNDGYAWGLNNSQGSEYNTCDLYASTAIMTYGLDNDWGVGCHDGYREYMRSLGGN